MRNLSKSKLISFRQCPKRMWLELHTPDLAEISESAEARFRVGHQVGDIARRLYDPQQCGTLINAQEEGYPAAFKRSLELLQQSTPIFEAGYESGGALAFADVMLPTVSNGEPGWRMVEVKSSTTIKRYHSDDLTIQAHVALAAGVPLTAVAIAHIDSSWEYQGDEDYRGLLKEVDLTEAVLARHPEVADWILQAQSTAAAPVEPSRPIGPHCQEPFECPFHGHCRGDVPPAQHSVSDLPRHNKALKAHIEEHRVSEMAELPDELLSTLQQRVKTSALTGVPYFDVESACQDLSPHQPPAVFLDFETVMFAVPIWKGTRPYQQVPFQFSAHRLSECHELEHVQHLDLTGHDPRPGFASALIEACGSLGPVFAYNAGFEKARIRELALHLPAQRQQLLAITERLVDLLPIARLRYYHPSQHGSWSLKSVLPAMCPDLTYESLEEIQDGGAAMEAYAEAIDLQTSPERKTEIQGHLLAYCHLDTYALVRLWLFLSGAPKKTRSH